jgi:hypothetical protein
LAGLQLISSLTLAVATFACAAPDGEAEGEAEAYAPTAFVDEGGREWVSRGQAKFADTLELEAARDLEPSALDLYWGSYADRKQNYATRINSTVISFVQKHSAQ